MKIAFLNFYGGIVYRGVETFVHEVANRLSDSHEVTVYQSGQKLPGTRYKVIIINQPIDLERKNSYIPFLNYFGRKIGSFTIKALKVIDPKTDVVFPTNGQWESFLCKIWSLKHRSKMIVSGQSGPGIDDRINLWSFPDTFIALTEFQAKWAKKTNPFINITKIRNGVDLTKFTAKGEKIMLNLPKPIILCVAAFDYWKRNELIIKAVSKLNKGSLLLIGKGAEGKKLQSLGEKLLPGRFKILSFAHDQMTTVYRAADIFTYATVPWESFGIVLAEAMASGLPIVATDDPIRREIVAEAGLFVDPTNTVDYANKLKESLGRKWGDIPRKQAEKFSWDKIAQAYETLFLSLK